MSVLSYQGAGIYNMYLGQSLIVIDEEQIVELVTELFNNEHNFEIPFIDAMIEEKQELKDEIQKLQGELETANEEAALLMMQLQEKETE